MRLAMTQKEIETIMVSIVSLCSIMKYKLHDPNIKRESEEMETVYDKLAKTIGSIPLSEQLKRVK